MHLGITDVKSNQQKGKIIMATLAEIRARLQQSENKNTGFKGDNAIYPHWNMPEGSTAKLRFLPDGDPKNDFFWVERLMIKLPFAGIKGQMDSKPVTVQVPCVEMWGDTCPILSEVRPWYKDKSLEQLANKYWKKRSYLFQGFVKENPIAEESIPENPIRRFIIGPQIYSVIKAALMDTEIEVIPTDYDRGLDFSITKTSKGGFADYSTSKWSRKETALNGNERSAIDTHGLFDLKSFLPKRPNASELAILSEMFEASVDGQAYDPDRWANHFKPAGLQTGSGEAASDEDNKSSTKAKFAPKPAVSKSAEVETPPFDVDETPAVADTAPKATTSNARAEDILQMIRNRQK